MLAVTTKPEDGGTIVTLGGVAGDNAAMWASLADALASLAEDGWIAVDVSEMVLAPFTAVKEMVERLSERFDDRKLFVICSRRTGRRLLRRIASRLPVFPSATDVLLATVGAGSTTSEHTQSLADEIVQTLFHSGLVLNRGMNAQPSRPVALAMEQAIASIDALIAAVRVDAIAESSGSVAADGKPATTARASAAAGPARPPSVRAANADRRKSGFDRAARERRRSHGRRATDRSYALLAANREEPGGPWRLARP